MSRGRRRPYKKYSDADKAAFVVMLEAAGYPHVPGALERVVKETNVSRATLRDWHTKGIHYGNENTTAQVEVLMDRTRLTMTELLDNAVRNALDKMEEKLENEPENISYKDLSLTVAIFTDKLQLLNDKPTQNIQQGISFVRSGISTLREFPAPLAIESVAGDEEV